MVVSGRVERMFTAIDEDTYDGTSSSPIGFGQTEAEAIEDLRQKIEDNDA